MKEFLRLPALFSLSNKEAIGLEHAHRNLPGLGRHQCEESQKGRDRTGRGRVIILEVGAREVRQGQMLANEDHFCNQSPATQNQKETFMTKITVKRWYHLLSPLLWALDHRVLPQRLKTVFYLSEAEDRGHQGSRLCHFRAKLTDFFNKSTVSFGKNLLTTCETLDTLLKLLRYKLWGLKTLWGSGMLTDDNGESVS